MVSFSFTLHTGSYRLAITLLSTPSHSRTQVKEYPHLDHAVLKLEGKRATELEQTWNSY